MSMPVNQKTFENMIDENIEWLRANAPESVVYRDHIEQCLQMCKRHYQAELKQKPDSAWNG